MRSVLLILVFFYQVNAFSQKDVYFYKDVSNKVTLEDIKDKEFLLLENEISEGYTNATYWFKIPVHETALKYVFRITYDRYNEANVYKNTDTLEKLPNQRYLTYRFSRENDIYVQIKPKLHSYLPIEFDTEEESFLLQKHQLILNCFYYGVTFLVILYNFFYFFLFKDDGFLYYSLFLGFMCIGIYTMDGMLNFYNINGILNDSIMVLNYVLMAFFSSKFANSYLFLDEHYPTHKKYSYVIGVAIIITAILYLIFENYYYLLALNISVFLLIFIYWVVSIFLFKNNFYTKIFTLAYVLLLFSAIDYFVLKFLGLSIVKMDSTTIKIGAFIEMIVLSFAVLYRMKILKEENLYMRNEIVNYSKQLISFTSSEKQKNKYSIEELSQRERQIFNLIVLVKTNKEIANELIISVNTVKFHVKNIYEKLNIKSRREAQNLRDSL